MQKTTSGFTIVELLIVIVVIAILAVVAVVAYNGIQNRANDSAVQSNVRNFASKVREYRILEGHYPVGGGTARAFVGLDDFSLARAAYDTTQHNFVYCRGIVAGVDTFAVAAESKSGNVYVRHSQTGPDQLTGSWGNSIASRCAFFGIPSTSPDYSYTFGYNNGSGGTWYGWTE